MLGSMKDQALQPGSLLSTIKEKDTKTVSPT